MKICFVVGEFPALSHTFVLDQVVAMSRLGHEVIIVCDRIGSDARIDFKSEPVRSLMSRTRRWWQAPPMLGDNLRRLPPRLRDKLSTAADMYWNRAINDCDVVVAHFGGNGLRLARAKKRGRLAPPIVTIFHGNDIGVHHHSGTLGHYAPLFAYGARHLTVNAVFRDALIQAGAKESDVVVHHMGVDCDEIAYQWRNWRDGPLELISVCRLVEKKGIQYALNAVAKLGRSRPSLDWRYTIIGDGPMAAELKKIAAELQLGMRVRFLGAQPHSEVKTHLARSHVFLLPSVTAQDGDVEGIPVALMEAAASGLIVVTTRHSGIPELIEDQKSGFLSDETDATGLAQNLARIGDDHKACRPMTLAARAHVELEFNKERLNTRLCDLLAPLAERADAA